MKARLALLTLAAALGAALVAAQQPYRSATSYATGVLPVYAGGIAEQPPPAAAPVGEPPWVQRIEQKLDRLLKLVEDEAAAEKGPPAAGDTKVGAGDALVSAAGACAACHAPELAKEAGGDFTFFQAADGGLNMIPASTQNEWRTLKRQVSSGKMPPPGNKRGVPALTPAQKAALEKWLDENQPKK